MGIYVTCLICLMYMYIRVCAKTVALSLEERSGYTCLIAKSSVGLG